MRSLRYERPGSVWGGRGKAVTEEGMLKDIQLLKQLNFNAVRCAHYPNWFRWCAPVRLPRDRVESQVMFCVTQHQGQWLAEAPGPLARMGGAARSFETVLLLDACALALG